MKRFLECLIPLTLCNLKCEYCYVIQEGRRSMTKPVMQYSPEQIGMGLSVERLGGVSYVSICGSGETMMAADIVSVVYNVLKQGHFVNVTTNGTISKRFDEIVDTFPGDYLKRLHFAFSFHYLELLKHNKLDEFFNNISKIRSAGCSFTLQINLYDAYMPHWDEIKRISKEKVGAYPQVALTRDESVRSYRILTEGTNEKYISVGKEMDSPLFDFTVKNFMVRRREFCYAGAWSGKLNLATGILSGCYGYGIIQNIFKDISKPIKFEALGKNCMFKFCFNSSHFMSLGCVPSIKTPTYAELRNRRESGWYTDEMEAFLSGKLSDDNSEYPALRKHCVTFKYYFVNKFRSLRYRLLYLFAATARRLGARK